MSIPRGRSPFKQNDSQSRRAPSASEGSSLIPTRQIEAFGRTLNATASQILGGGETSHHYQNALGEIHRELRKPIIQRSVLALARSTPKQVLRSTFSTAEIQHRALAHVPEELLRNIPEPRSAFSLFQGYEASQPPENLHNNGKHGRTHSKTQKHVENGAEKVKGRHGMVKLRNKKKTLDHRLTNMAIRKNMCASEILEIDSKISNLHGMRRVVLDRLAALELEETDLEHEIADLSVKLDEMEDSHNDEVHEDHTPGASTTQVAADAQNTETTSTEDDFMSQSVFEKIPANKTRKRKTPRRTSMPILHEHLSPGTNIKQFQAHDDVITALDFDAPFGTMVSAALDDTLRVWNLNSGTCIGLLEGHLSSVRCIQVEDNIVASGSNDATIRLWDLSQADYTPIQTTNKKPYDDEEEGEEQVPEHEIDSDSFEHVSSKSSATHTHAPSSMADCPLFTLSSHVAEVTAIHFHGQTLMSGSADKTLRQWDLHTGRCVQTLDVLWASAQASSQVATPFNSVNTGFSSSSPAFTEKKNTWFRPTLGRTHSSNNSDTDFVGALQVFQSAVACGTADSVVRLWDLRSGGVQRQLIGHTGGVTALQFDDVHLVTGSADRSIRIWDLRTGSIFDAFAYESAITSMQFDQRRICATACENVVKVYDKTEGHQWDCGAGAQSEPDPSTAAVIEKVRVRDGYMIEGRKNGMIGIWSC